MNREILQKIVVLESIRKTGNKVPYPLEGGWLDLQLEIEALVENDLLSIDSDQYKITSLGKKVLLIIQDERDDFLADQQKFKDFAIRGRLYDARIAVQSYKLRRQPNAKHLLEDFCIWIVWDDFFDQVKLFNRKGYPWQKHLWAVFERNIQHLARNLDEWKRLGSTESEARRVASRLAGELPQTKLVQITK